MSKNSKVHTIIHGAAAAAAAAGTGLAQIPLSDNAVITPIQIAMIIAIGEVHGQRLSKAAALTTLSAASAGVAGRALSQFLVGWIPLYGNAVNATTAFALTEAIGWAADRILGGDETNEDAQVESPKPVASQKERQPTQVESKNQAPVRKSGGVDNSK